MPADERIFSSLLDLFNVALAIIFGEISRSCISSIHPSVLSFFQQRLFLIVTFVSSPVSSKVNGIFLAHGFSSFGRCPFGCFCCEIPRTKSLESLNWFRPKWWLLELALSASSLSLPLLPVFPFRCCSAFYLHCLWNDKAEGLLTCHFSVAQMRVLVILWYTDITRCAFLFFICFIYAF